MKFSLNSVYEYVAVYQCSYFEACLEGKLIEVLFALHPFALSANIFLLNSVYVFMAVYQCSYFAACLKG